MSLPSLRGLSDGVNLVFNALQIRTGSRWRAGTFRATRTNRWPPGRSSTRRRHVWLNVKCTTALRMVLARDRRWSPDTSTPAWRRKARWVQWEDGPALQAARAGRPSRVQPISAACWTACWSSDRAASCSTWCCWWRVDPSKPTASSWQPLAITLGKAHSWLLYYLRIENAEGYVLIAVYLFIYLYACYSHNRKSFKPNRMKFGGMIGYYPGTIWLDFGIKRVKGQGHG